MPLRHKTSLIHSVISVQRRCVTDRRTDVGPQHTSLYAIRNAFASCSKNSKVAVVIK